MPTNITKPKNHIISEYTPVHTHPQTKQARRHAHEHAHEAHLGGEPEGNLLLSRLNSVGSVADVAANVNAKVAPDGAGEGIRGLGGAEKDAASLDNTVALPALRAIVFSI